MGLAGASVLFVTAVYNSGLGSLMRGVRFAALVGACALVLDQDLEVRRVLVELLKRRFDVFDAESGDEAMEKFARIHPSRVFLGPGCGLVDERLSLLREITHLSPQARVVVLLRPTDDDSLAREALRAGAFAATTSDAAGLRRAVAELDEDDRAASLV